MTRVLMELLPHYERTQRALDRSDGGVQSYVASLRVFFAWLAEDATLEDLTYEACLDYRDSLGEERAAGSTVINKLAAISSFAEWAIERRLIDANPTIGIRRPPKATPNPQPLSVEQVAKLLTLIEQPAGLTPHKAWRWRRNRRAVHLMLFAGLRLNEARLLEWRHIDFADNIIALSAGTKGSRPRRVALHPVLRDELLRSPEHERQPTFAVCGFPTGDPLTYGGMEHIVDYWLGKELDADTVLGVHLHAHKLRSTFATFFVRSGGDVLTLQKLLGHRHVDTTQHYVLSDDEDKRQQMERLRFTRPVAPPRYGRRRGLRKR